MRKKLYVDGVDLSTFGLYISGQGTFGSGAKEFTFYNVPGRDGAVLGVNSRLENVSVTYPGFIYANFAQNMRDLRSFLLSRSGYVRIEDDYDSAHFRLGVFEEPISPDVTQKNDAGRFDLTFNCLPQRWLKSGETEIVITDNNIHYINNTTKFASFPVFRVFGYGNFAVVNPWAMANGYGVKVMISADLPTDYPSISSIYLDSQNMTVWSTESPGTNLSPYISTAWTNDPYTLGTVDNESVDFPKLYPSNNDVKKQSTITELRIAPKWWEA